MELRELAPEDDGRISPRVRESREGLDDAERRLEEDGRPGARRVRRVPAVALAAPRRRKPRNVNGTAGNPTPRGSRGRPTARESPPRGGRRRGRPRRAARPGPRRAASPRPTRARASRRPRGAEGLADAGVLVVAVAGDARRRQAVAREEISRAARVLAVDDGGRRERLVRARREVVEVPDRRRDDEEAAHARHLSQRRSAGRLLASGACSAGASCRGSSRRHPRAGAAPPAGPRRRPLPETVVLDRIAAVVGDDVDPRERAPEAAWRRLSSTRKRRARRTRRTATASSTSPRRGPAARAASSRKTGGIEPKREEVEARVAALEARVEKERGEPLDAILARGRGDARGAHGLRQARDGARELREGAPLAGDQDDRRGAARVHTTAPSARRLARSWPHGAAAVTRTSASRSARSSASASSTPRSTAGPSSSAPRRASSSTGADGQNPRLRARPGEDPVREDAPHVRARLRVADRGEERLDRALRAAGPERRLAGAGVVGRGRERAVAVEAGEEVPQRARAEAQGARGVVEVRRRPGGSRSARAPPRRRREA